MAGIVDEAGQIVSQRLSLSPVISGNSACAWFPTRGEWEVRAGRALEICIDADCQPVEN